MTHQRPAAYVPASATPLASDGGGTWSDALVDYSWSMRDIADHHHLMGTCGHGVFFVCKAKVRQRGMFKRLLWIQYTEALLSRSVYTPPPTPADPNPWPWIGIDRYPNTTGRTDRLPYAMLPEVQQDADWGWAYEGRVKSLYAPGDADTVDVDWACSGGMVDWAHVSVLSLVGRGHTGREWRLGSLFWRWSVDAAGRFSYGARPADDADIALWRQRLTEGYPDYARDVFAGDWPS